MEVLKPELDRLISNGGNEEREAALNEIVRMDIKSFTNINIIWKAIVAIIKLLPPQSASKQTINFIEKSRIEMEMALISLNELDLSSKVDEKIIKRLLAVLKFYSQHLKNFFLSTGILSKESTFKSIITLGGSVYLLFKMLDIKDEETKKTLQSVINQFDTLVGFFLPSEESDFFDLYSLLFPGNGSTNSDERLGMEYYSGCVSLCHIIMNSNKFVPCISLFKTYFVALDNLPPCFNTEEDLSHSAQIALNYLLDLPSEKVNHCQVFISQVYFILNPISSEISFLILYSLLSAMPINCRTSYIKFLLVLHSKTRSSYNDRVARAIGRLINGFESSFIEMTLQSLPNVSVNQNLSKKVIITTVSLLKELPMKIIPSHLFGMYLSPLFQYFLSMIEKDSSKIADACLEGLNCLMSISIGKEHMRRVAVCILNKFKLESTPKYMYLASIEFVSSYLQQDELLELISCLYKLNSKGNTSLIIANTLRGLKEITYTKEICLALNPLFESLLDAQSDWLCVSFALNSLLALSQSCHIEVVRFLTPVKYQELFTFYIKIKTKTSENQLKDYYLDTKTMKLELMSDRKNLFNFYSAKKRELEKCIAKNDDEMTKKELEKKIITVKKLINELIYEMKGASENLIRREMENIKKDINLALTKY